MLRAIGDGTPNVVVHVNGEGNNSTRGVVEKSGDARNDKMENSNSINAVHYKVGEDRHL